VPRGVDQVELIDLTIAGLVFEGRRLGLDGDAALALDVHRIEHLRFHFAVGETTTALDQAVRERALAVVDVGNDGKVADVIHRAR
jgi:hypothetical protein